METSVSTEIIADVFEHCNARFNQIKTTRLTRNLEEDKISKYLNDLYDICTDAFNNIISPTTKYVSIKNSLELFEPDDEELEPNETQNLIDLNEIASSIESFSFFPKLCKSSQQFFRTGETLYNLSSHLTQVDLDYSFVLAPYVKTVERELQDKLISKIETFFYNYKMQLGSYLPKCSSFDRITLGNCNPLLVLGNVRLFVTSNFKRDTAAFIENELPKITRKLAKLRNPNLHKEITPKSVVDAFREILISQNFLDKISSIEQKPSNPS
jgi:hypothetical protein